MKYLNYKIIQKPFSIFLGSLLAVIISVFFHLPFGFLSTITVLILLQLFFDEVYSKVLERIMGPGFAFVVILFVIKLFHAHIIIETIIGSIITIIFIYYYAIQNFPYAMLIGGMTAAFMTELIYSTTPQYAIKFGGFWVINILIGACIIFFVKKITNYLYNKKSTIKLTTQSFVLFLKLIKPLKCWSNIAVLRTLRITLTLFVISAVNIKMHWNFINIQAIIAGIIVSAQLNIEKARYRMVFRIIGVIIGSITAIAYAHIMNEFPYKIFLVILIPISLFISSLLSELYPFFEYALLQAGIMVPLILMTSGSSFTNVSIAYARGLGSFEGALIGLLMVYLFHWPLQKIKLSHKR